MRFTWRILLASLRHQRARLSIAVLAMALGSAVSVFCEMMRMWWVSF